MSDDLAKRSRGASFELFDTHCHLNLEGLEEQAAEAWCRARAAGVASTVVVGIDAVSSHHAVALAEALPGVHAAVGIHPTSTAKVGSEDWGLVVELARSGNRHIVAIGESGLDFYWPDSPREVQIAALHQHVELALELDLPLILHIRDAYAEAAEQLAAAAAKGLRGIVHCFAGTEGEVEPFLAWNWPISFSGILTYPKAENVRNAARRTPLELCLLETDAPWLKPRGVGGAKADVNEPAFVLHTAKALAQVKGVGLAELAEITTANARRAFSLD